ncbi:MAG: ATP-binding protein, partial [Xanthobacteraceae bacterium]
LDIGSLTTPNRVFIAAGAALDALWVKAREEWNKALGENPSDDPRCPIFIVIDEAHNLTPAAPSSEAAKLVSEALIRIAMEGRKFGLFLILVTQRPSRLNENLLSQCDSLCLMKMSNPADIELVEKRFGFVPQDIAKEALGFKKGEMLLAGSFVDSPVLARVAPRRTIEGGRSLRDEVWLSEPTRTP